MKLPRIELYTKILIGLILGLIFGIIANKLGIVPIVTSYIKPFGTAFIRLISMIVVPLVFASLLVGTASLNDIRKLGRIGGKTVIYYLCTTAIAIIIGLLMANVFKPGTGLTEPINQPPNKPRPKYPTTNNEFFFSILYNLD